MCVCVLLFNALIQANLTHLPRSEYVPGIGLGIAKCPYDPQDNSTAIYVESGNPGGLPALVSIIENRNLVLLCTGKFFISFPSPTLSILFYLFY